MTFLSSVTKSLSHFTSEARGRTPAGVILSPRQLTLFPSADSESEILPCSFYSAVLYCYVLELGKNHVGHTLWLATDVFISAPTINKILIKRHSWQN